MAGFQDIYGQEAGEGAPARTAIRLGKVSHAIYY